MSIQSRQCALLLCCFILAQLMGFAQPAEEARQLCMQYIVKGKSIAKNESVDDKRKGYWSTPYDKNDDEITDGSKASSYSIINYKEDIPDGICAYCFKNGSLMGYRYFQPDTNLVMEGVFQWYDKQGRLWSEETFKDGKLHGITKEWYKNGTLQLEALYNDGLVERETWYSKKGKGFTVDEFQYENGDTILHHQSFRADSSVIIDERRVNGLLEGDYSIYFPDGSTELEARHVKGVRVYEKRFYKDGSLRTVGTCDEDKTNCMMKVYGADGKVKKEVPTKYKLVDKGVR